LSTVDSNDSTVLVKRRPRHRRQAVQCERGSPDNIAPLF